MSQTDPPPVAPGFAEALRAAVQARGLSLEGLRLELAARGHVVSAATLSYWQSGRSQPERPSSLATLAVLEDLLGVRPQELARLITRRRRSSVPPAAATRPAQRDAEVETATLLEHLAASIGLSWDHGLERVSVHDRMWLAGDRTEQSHQVREIIRATRPGVDRYPLWYSAEDVGVTPHLEAIDNCRIGRVAKASERNIVVVEMILDRPLLRGESVLVEHSVQTLGSRDPVLWWTRGVNRRVREIHLEVRFQPDDLPGVTQRFLVEGDTKTVHDVSLSGTSAHLLSLDFGPGTCGLQWSW